MKYKAAVHNLGCKVNAYEAEAMQQLLEKAGYEIVPFEPGADVYVINTCSVTNIADRKSRQMLHKAKKMNPDAIVVAAGCYAQTDTEGLTGDSAVDLILGNNRKQNLVEALEEYRRQKDRVLDVPEILRTREYEPLSIRKTAEHVRAYIKVQDGCNQFCSYCIIPYARGRVRSRQPEDIVSEITALTDAGYKEVVLTGIHLSSYGTDFVPEKKTSLLDLIRIVNEIPGICRIRLGSLEPGIVTEEFAKTLSEMPQICPHFHLSLQSGCDKTLAAMNRRYRAQEYRERCGLLRKYFPMPAITTDVITGFPGETEEDFEESRRFVEEMHFFETHVFPYSRRKGTKADGMEGQLPEAVRKARGDVLIRLSAGREREFAEHFLGKPLSVLLEEETVLEGKPYLTGHSMEYIRVSVPVTEGLRVNDIITVKAERFLEDYHCNLTGNRLE